MLDLLLVLDNFFGLLFPSIYSLCSDCVNTIYLFSISLILSCVIFTLLNDFHFHIDPIQWGFVPNVIFLSFIICLFEENLKLIVEAFLCLVLEIIVTPFCIWVHLRIDVSWLSFLIHIVSVLILCMMDSFWLFPWYFVFYIRRMQGLLISFILADDNPV